MDNIKIALVHDWLTGMRGGERCLEVFCELFPDADLFTLLHVPGSVSPIIERLNIKTSFIQGFPFSRKGYRKYLPFFPMAIERFILKRYDLILSLSHCVAKGIIPSPDSVHVSYLLTPMRYAWDMYEDYFGKGRNRIISMVMHYLRMWDVTSSQRVDYFLCISRHVAKRIEKFYRREADIIHPPVDTKRFGLTNHREDFFLIVSNLSPYKRVDLAIEAFNQLKHPLQIIGAGSEEKRLRSMAGPKISFLGWQPDGMVAERYSKCRALIFPGEEDFGIVPLEAMASGRPVIAYGRGGALETIIPYGHSSETESKAPTGLFFSEQSPEALIDGVERFLKVEKEFDPVAIRNHALKWDCEIFKEKIRNFLYEKIGLSC